MSNLEPLVESLDDPALDAAAAGLRPPLRPRDPLPASVVRFAPAFLTYRTDAHGGGTRVYLYGTDEFGHSVAVRASGFYPYLYVELVAGLDARKLIDELAATLLLSLALDARQWAPERRAARAAVAGTLQRRGGRTLYMAPQHAAHALPIVGYETVPATILRGNGGDYGYRGIEPRWLLKIYFYSPAMLVRARALLHGKHAHLAAEEQAAALSRTAHRLADAAAAPEADTRRTIRSFMRNVDRDDDAAAAPDTASSPTDTAADDPDDAYADELGNEWQTDDTPAASGAANLPPGALAAAQGDDGRERLEQRIEHDFVAVARAGVRRARPTRGAGILSRLTEARPLKVCDADLEFVLRFCVDTGISPCAWVEIDTQKPALTPAAHRDAERNGREHSADGVHAGFPDATWMLDRAPPGIAPHELYVCSAGSDAWAVDAAETYAQIELQCDFHRVVPVADETMQVRIAQPVRVSFDCEMETGPNNEFPRPESQRVLNIGVAIPYPKHAGAARRWRLLIFGLHQYARGPPPPDADRTTLCFADERLMLRAFFRFLATLRPDEVMSFNGHTFDIPYLAERSHVLGIHDEFVSAWAKRRAGAPLRMRPRVFESVAHGRHEMIEVSAEGVVFIDIYQMAKRNTGIRLASYSLDSLSAHFLRDHKVKVSPAEINGLHATPEGRYRLGTYVLKDAMLPEMLDRNQRWMLGHIEKARQTGCTLQMLIERGMGIQGKSLSYRWARRGLLVPAEAAAIGVADAGRRRLCVHYTRTDYDRAHEHSDFEGAIVLEPVIGAHDVPVATFDFNSLYPSEQISANMCSATLIDPSFDYRADRYLAHLVASGRFTWDTVVRPMRKMVTETPYTDAVPDDPTAFVAPGALQGLLPEIQRSNLSRRKEVRNQMASLQDRAKQLGAGDEAADLLALIEVLDQRQLALKLVANSMYGLGGSPTSFSYAPRIAAAVTQGGRTHIYYAKSVAESLFSLTLDSPLVQRVRAFPGVANLLLKLPSGERVVDAMFEQIRRARAAAATRPLEQRRATDAGTVAIGPSRTALPLTRFFGTAQRVGAAASAADADALDADVRLRVVYGDTDSLFARFWRGADLALVGEFCAAAADFISVCMHVTYGTGNPADCVFRIEFEKLAAAFLLLGKKKYAMLKYVLNKHGVLEPKPAENVPSLSGMEAGKRDTTRYVARGQQVVISILLDRRYPAAENMRRAVVFIYRELVLPLLENRADPYDLVQTKQLRKTVEAYTRDGGTAPVHVQLAALLARRAAAGGDDAPRPGDRIPYVIRRGDPAEPLSARGESPAYAYAHGVPLDVEYYLGTHVGPCLGRIFAPLVTAHRVDVRTDAERLALVREFLFGSRVGYAPPADIDKYDFSEYRDRSDFAPRVVRYPTRRRLDLAQSSFMRALQPGVTCTGCGEFLAGRRPGAVCADCMQRDPERHVPALAAAVASLQLDEQALLGERAAIVRKCQTCAGCGDRYRHIACDEWDCLVRWKRLANEQALSECDARSVDVARSLAAAHAVDVARAAAADW